MTPAASVSLLKDEGYPLMLHTSHLCAILGVCATTLHKRIRSGDVPAWTRVGSGRGVRYEWHRPDVDRWLVNRRQLRRAS